jgi:uncharacterized protein with LGFP repeats
MIGLAGVAVVCLTASNAAAFQVYGAIADKWRAMGGQSGPLGAPRSDEADAAHGGRFNNFAHGFIYWHPRLGAHAVYGLIGEKWNAMGRERNLGYPITDELPAAGGGRYNDFENHATIIWHPRTGTHAVYGLIRDRWIALQRESGGCGYPTSDEFDAEGGRRSNFQRGFITWRAGQRSAQGHCSVTIDQGTALNPVQE